MNVVSGNGVTSAVKAAGKSGKVKLVEFDAEPLQVQALKAGTIDALVAQDPYGIGQKAVALAYQYLTRATRPASRSTTARARPSSRRPTPSSPAIKKFLYTK